MDPSGSNGYEKALESGECPFNFWSSVGGWDHLGFSDEASCLSGIVRIRCLVLAENVMCADKCTHDLCSSKSEGGMLRSVCRDFEEPIVELQKEIGKEMFQISSSVL